MSRSADAKLLRHKQLIEYLQKNPFKKDEELAEYFGVSVPTIRLDRSELQIPELRSRINDMANNNLHKVKSIKSDELMGELIELELNKKGTLILEADKGMTFGDTDIVRGQTIYSMAESIAMAVIDANAALVGVANIKYRTPIKSGDLMVARAELKNIRGNNYFVWVKIYVNDKVSFRGKFILVV